MPVDHQLQEDFMATLRLGDTAPDFTQDSSGGPACLHPQAGGVCTTPKFNQ